MIDVTRISSKGQVVIPKPIRESLKLREGDRLIAYARGDLIILKRLKGGRASSVSYPNPRGRKWKI
jgi:AbrB family looped-hinge helix DNA binding protein